MVGWEEISDQSLSHESMFFAPRAATFQIFDPTSNSFLGEPSQTIELPSDVYIHEFAASHEGGFFLVTKSPGEDEFVNGDNFTIWQIDANGDANKWALEIKPRNADIPPGDIDITVLSNGNLATAWFEYELIDSGELFYKRYLNLQIVDKDGSTAVFNDLITPQGKNVHPYWHMTQAANGNIVIFWSHLEQEIGTVDWDMEGIVTVSTTHYISILDQSGELINQITVPSSDAPHGPGSLLALEDGGFVFVELQETNYESVDGSSYDPTQRLILHVYNADGTARHEKIIFAEFDDSDLTTFEIESLQNGGFAVSFSFDEWLDGAHGAQRLYTVRFTADGKIIYPTLSDEDDWGTCSADDDRIDTFAGDDYAAGGDGGDTLLGREGDDTLDGEEGNDVVAGGQGNDSLFGGAGNDSISGSLGHARSVATMAMTALVVAMDMIL